MEKELCTIAEKLKDVPEGYCINIRHPLGSSDIVKTESSRGVPERARLKSETFELYPGIELSFHCWLADQFHIRHCHGVSTQRSHFHSDTMKDFLSPWTCRYYRRACPGFLAMQVWTPEISA